ncbi:MAG: hypothetical protein GW878_04520 [Acidobacteria bacterium]|nr:hypothetical protein [Acidobacteriota bacterium]
MFYCLLGSEPTLPHRSPLRKPLPLARKQPRRPLVQQLHRPRSQLLGRHGLGAEDLIALYEEWIAEFPIVAIEDGLAEDDWGGWKQMRARLGDKILLIGDDIFVTNPKIIARGIVENVANAVLIKLNQIGTLTETQQALRLALHHGWGAMVSHRSGETEDTTIADLVVASGCGLIKTGSASRSERIAKYNRLLHIEEELGSAAQFAGRGVFSR